MAGVDAEGGLSASVAGSKKAAGDGEDLGRGRFPCGEAKAEGKDMLDSEGMEGGVWE
ncbi:hypothetical protein TIFTF001_023861 [Ficus carica]|uniref:Uncharacterized protein n=1 Tax=Ficus carica TaxID=3494 RepID=A0AA88DK94_FICCA|nr:hypothetical protein TIFTF001_023861 [Ficus carica]